MRSRGDRLTIPTARPLEVVSERPSIVVLPFVDLSPEAAGSVLTDGLTEEATNALARMPGFFVTARHSAMAYKGVAADVRAIAAELGVRYVMEGSLEHWNGRVRVNARLIDGGTGLHLWADRHELAAREVLAVRDEMVQAIAGRLQPSLAASEIDLALRRPTEQLDAWGWMQRALGALLHFDQRRDALTRALDPLKRALELDPDYAMAHALLSAVYTWRTLSYAFPDPDGERKLARRHAEMALRLEPDNPFVLVHCAETAIYSAARIDDARAMLETAVNRNPNDAHGLAMLGNTRRFAGDDARTSLALIEQAMRVSPRDPRSYTWLHYGSWCHWKLGELAEMEAMSRRSVDLYPAYPHSWIALTCALGLQDKAAEAREAAQNLRRLHPKFGAANFYNMAERFYGHRFPGAVSAEYRQLRGVLAHAGADAPVDLPAGRSRRRGSTLVARRMEETPMPEPGRARPRPTPETKHFWDGTRAGELRLQRCERMQQGVFPAAPVLPCLRFARGERVSRLRSRRAVELRHPSPQRARLHAALRDRRRAARRRAAPDDQHRRMPADAGGVASST